MSKRFRKPIGYGVPVLIFPLLMMSGAMASDAANGERLARRWCASCHVVATNQRQASADAPAFSEIAHKPHIDADKLAEFLRDPHPKMPDMSLTRDESSDLAGYILTQKK